MNKRTRINTLLCTLVAVLGMTSCWDDNESETIYTNRNNALITSLSLKDNSNVASGLSGYTFTVDQTGQSDPSLVSRYQSAIDGQIGIIFNPDSLPVGTDPDSIKMTLSYSSPYSVKIKQYDYDGNIMVDKLYNSDSAWYFSDYPETRIEVTAYDRVTVKTYFLKINVHRVYGDTVRWRYIASPEAPVFDASTATDQRVDTMGDQLYWFRQYADGTQRVAEANLKVSLKQWSDEIQITSPEALDLSTLYNWDGALYAVGQETGALLCSDDAYAWRVKSDAFRFVSILGEQLASNWYAENLKAVVLDAGVYSIANSLDGLTWNIERVCPENFPVKGYSMPISVAARPKYGNITSRLYITGGRTSDGRLVSSSWSSDGTTWVEFPQNDLPGMTGASIVQYTLDIDDPGTFWILHPGQMAEGKVDRTLWYSENSGVTWKKLKRWYSYLSDNSKISPVACSSAFFNPSDYMIYFFGGVDAAGQQVGTIYGGNYQALTFEKKR